MRRRTGVMVAVAAAVVVSIGAGGAALASSDDGDAGVSGKQADRAVAAALRVTGGGHANSVERDSENGATWEVEVTKPDGNTVDVRLGADYSLVVVEGDSEAQ